MAEWEVIGYENVNYFSKKSNRQVVGKKVYCCSIIDSSSGDGMATEVFYCSDRSSACSDLKIGDIVSPVYNRFGRLEDLVVVKKIK